MRAGFSGQLWTQAEGPDDPDRQWAAREGINVQTGRHAKGLGKDVMHYGTNSGYQAIGLAYLMGARKILLLGYDMSLDEAGKRHFFGDHPGALHTGSDYRGWAPLFLPLAVDLAHEGVEVINCSRRTALTAFKRGTL